MSRARHRPLGVIAVIAAALMLPTSATAASSPAAATAPPVGLLEGLVLTGTCPGQSSDLKSVITTPLSASPWGRIHLLGSDFSDLKKVLVPHEITVTGEGLKTRHAVPGLPYTKPGRTPANPVTCVFDGATKLDGPFKIVVTGAIRGQITPNCPRHVPREAGTDGTAITESVVRSTAVVASRRRPPRLLLGRLLW